jgi:hypothetical protein
VAVEPVILSHKRAGAVTTHRFIANCTVCVPESQAAEYQAKHPTLPQLVHPDEVVGLWAKREWVRQQIGDHMQLDDDMIGVYRVYRPMGSWKKSVLGPERAYELIQATGDRARQLGAYLFGFGQHAHPLTFNGLKPFRFGGYSPGGAIGVLEGHKFWWPTDTTLGDGDDYWVCLLNAHLHRYAFYDRRFTCGFKDTYSNAGGLTEFRSGEANRERVEWEVLAYLQRHFGSDVIVRNFRGPDAATKRIKNPGRRQIVLPWNH